MAQKYKHLKEQFVSNLGGGSVAEINYVTLAPPAAILLWSALQSRLGFFRQSSFLASAVEFILTCLIPLGAVTVYSSHPVLLDAALITPALLLLLQSKELGSGKRRAEKSQPQAIKQDGVTKTTDREADQDLFPPKAFLTNYRGGMILITCIAILAVDFRIFPRRFAKVETWGTSLMDLGVGSFVFSAGVVSAKPVCRELHGKTPQRLGERFRGAFFHSVPLLVLGFIRLYSVKGLDYAEHVTEYGVHWNFFFTLAFLGPFATIIQSMYSIIPSFAILALILSISYESILRYTSLTAFVLTAPRVDLLSQNREGIFSLFGYVAIFLLGEEAGLVVLPRQVEITPPAESLNNSKKHKRKGIRTSLRDPASVRLLMMTGTLLLLYHAVSNRNYGLGLQVSRRLANLPYVLWVSAFNLAQVLLFWGLDQSCFKTDRVGDVQAQHQDHTSATLRAFNRNGLAIFLTVS